MHVGPTPMGGGWVTCVIGGYGGGIWGGGYLTIPNTFCKFSYTNLTLYFSRSDLDYSWAWI